MRCAAFAAAATALNHHLSASPFINVTMLARPQGSAVAFSSTVAVTPNSTVEYQVIFDVAPTGTVNVQGSVTRTITSLTPGIDGVNGHKFDIYQSAADAIQVNFSGPGTLNPDPSPLPSDDWGAGISAQGGIATPRAATSNNDLIGVRPSHVLGAYSAIDPEVVLFGAFNVSAFSTGAASSLNLRYSTVTPSGIVKVNGAPTIFLAVPSESTTDPLTKFFGITLTPAVTPPPPATAWNVDNSGNWADSSNWTAGVPNGSGAVANLTFATTAMRAVTIDTLTTLSTLNVNSPNAYQLTGAGPLRFTGLGATLNALSPLVVGVPVDLQNSLNINVASEVSIDVTSPISGSGSLSKSGAGVLTLAPGSSYTGGTSFSAGVVRISTADSLGNSSAALAMNGGTLQLLSSLILPQAINFGGNGGTIDTSGHDATLSGFLEGLSLKGITKAGAGILTLTTPGHMVIKSAITGGTLRAGVQNIVTSSGHGQLAISPGATFDLNNFNQSIDSVSGSGSVLLGSATLTLQGFPAATYAGIISGTGGLTLTRGKLTLTGSNTYTGPTIVNSNARLIIAPTATVNSPIALDSGTLAAAGNLGPVSLGAAASIAPGDIDNPDAPVTEPGGNAPVALSPVSLAPTPPPTLPAAGILHAASLTTAPGTQFILDIFGSSNADPNIPQFDQIIITSAAGASINGLSLNLDVGSAFASSALAGTRFFILDSQGPITGQLYNGASPLPDSSLISSNNVTFRLNYNLPGDPLNTGNNIALTVVPEPASLALLSTAALTLRRKRRHRA